MAEKKVRDQPLSQRQTWVNRCDELVVVRQCRLAGIACATVYASKVVVADEYELMLLPLLDEKYTRHPFYGSRKMTVWLRTQGHSVNRKRVQRLMRVLALVAMVPGPNTSKKHPQHTVYPYLLRGLSIIRSNQVWSTDITYVRLAHGFVYLVAIIDCRTRWTSVFVWLVWLALNEHGAPESFNTDQGSQFTSEKWIKVLQENGVKISMDGRGRALDNIFVERLWRSVKYEDIYPKSYACMPELLLGLAEYFVFYNGERIHEALGYKTPDEVYRTGEGGGAKIVDHFSDKQSSSAEEVGQRQSAVTEPTPS